MANDKKAVVAIAKEPTVQESVTKVFDLLGGVSTKPGATTRPSWKRTAATSWWSPTPSPARASMPSM